MKYADKLDFGKYKGEVLIDVMIRHSDYVLWCIENISGFCIEPKVVQGRFIALHPKAEKQKPQTLEFYGMLINDNNPIYLQVD